MDLFLMFELAHVQLIIETIEFQQFFMAAFFNDLTVFHYQYYIGFLYGGKTVSDNEACLSFHQAGKGILDLQFSTGTALIGLCTVTVSVPVTVHRRFH